MSAIEYLLSSTAKDDVIKNVKQVDSGKPVVVEENSQVVYDNCDSEHESGCFKADGLAATLKSINLDEDLVTKVLKSYNKHKVGKVVLGTCSNTKDDEKTAVEKNPKFDFKIEVNGCLSVRHLSDFSRYCLALGNHFLQFEKQFKSLKSGVYSNDYNYWNRQVFYILVHQISAYPTDYNLSKVQATSKKLEVFLKNTDVLFTNLVVNLPVVHNVYTIEVKKEKIKQQIKNSVSIFGAIGMFLQSLYHPLT